MEYAEKEGADWRSALEIWIEENLGHSVFNPNSESERYLARKLQNGNIRALKFDNVEEFGKLLKGVVDLDTKEIAHKSDYVVCLWDESAQKGAGTKGEVTIAKFFRKPVYLVTEMKRQDIPGWVLGCVTKFFDSFEDLKTFLLTKYSSKG